MIYYFTPYQKKNLGSAYNQYCSLVPNDDDWITFTDGDIMQLHLDWGNLWGSILEKNNDSGIITCLTNRASKNNLDQVCFDMYEETNILNHKLYAKKLLDENFSKTKEMEGSFLSGFFFSFKKSIWKKVQGFDEGILGVDTKFYEKVKSVAKCIVAQDFYVFHYYRMLEGDDFKEHLL